MKRKKYCIIYQIKSCPYLKNEFQYYESRNYQYAIQHLYMLIVNKEKIISFYEEFINVKND